MTMFSVIVPVYNNSENIPALLEALDQLFEAMDRDMEVVLVVDGPTDDSYARLAAALPRCSFPSQLHALTRNYGALAAVRAGLAAGNGQVFGVMAADLQEPSELLLKFQEHLSSGEYDVAVGLRQARHDAPLTNFLSGLFWSAYRKLVVKDIPAGGVDIFGCTRQVRDELLNLLESHSSLIGLLYWVGFRRVEVPYIRRAREVGVSGWTFVKKFNYLLDSVFSFSELPVRLLSRVGVVGLLLAFTWASLIAYAKFSGQFIVPGYSALMFAILFFGGLNCLGLGMIGEYAWRAFENTKSRPHYIVAHSRYFEQGSDSATPDSRPQASAEPAPQEAIIEPTPPASP